MTRIFKIENGTWSQNALVLIVRLAAAALMINHGFPKLLKLFSGDEIKFVTYFGLGAAFWLFLVVFSEFFCSILIAFGLKTRWASVPLIITMLFAAFVAHGSDPIEKKEKALLYVLLYVLILAIGSGKFSIDALLAKEKR